MTNNRHSDKNLDKLADAIRREGAQQGGTVLFQLNVLHNPIPVLCVRQPIQVVTLEGARPGPQTIDILKAVHSLMGMLTLLPARPMGQFTFIARVEGSASGLLSPGGQPPSGPQGGPESLGPSPPQPRLVR